MTISPLPLPLAPLIRLDQSRRGNIWFRVRWVGESAPKNDPVFKTSLHDVTPVHHFSFVVLPRRKGLSYPVRIQISLNIASPPPIVPSSSSYSQFRFVASSPRSSFAVCALLFLLFSLSLSASIFLRPLSLIAGRCVGFWTSAEQWGPLICQGPNNKHFTMPSNFLHAKKRAG